MHTHLIVLLALEFKSLAETIVTLNINMYIPLCTTGCSSSSIDGMPQFKKSSNGLIQWDGRHVQVDKQVDDVTSVGSVLICCRSRASP